MKTFNEWVIFKESATIWEKHKELPSLFQRTYYSLPTSEQLDEFKNYPELSAEDIVQGFGYTIVGRGVNSPQNEQKIVDSIKLLVNRYPEHVTYKKALVLAQEKSKK